MKKRILTLALATISLLLLVTSPAHMADHTSFPDVSMDASYAEAVEVLAGLEILKGDDAGNFKTNNTITRAEAATVIYRLLGVEEEAQSLSTSVFCDVPAGHWAAGYIAKAAELGIISGYGDGTFGPADPLTQQQIIKMLVCAWGYEYDAEDLGGWPNGYARTAESLGIIEDADYIANVAASRSMVAEWVYNILYVYENVE